MRVYIKSNFVVPGLETQEGGDSEGLDLDRSEITLKEFLEELSARTPDCIEYVRPGADTLDPAEWEVKINGIPYQNFSDGLETLLRDGDTVTISMRIFGGG
jgi:hypothetical protein